MIKRLLIAAGVASATVVASLLSAAADDPVPRLALVIGNATYPDADAPLKEVIADARAVADELRHDGFDVATGENLGRAAMAQAIDTLYGKIKPQAIVVVFFSGFGIQSGGQTFVIPVDAQLWTESDVRRDGVNLDAVLDDINSRGAGAKVAILDASRRNPFERRFRAASAGLAPPAAAQNSLVIYSAAPRTVLPDVTTDHGMFVTELIKEMASPDLTAEEALLRTRDGVSRASGGTQIPWVASSLTTDFSFDPDKPPQGTVTPPVRPPGGGGPTKTDTQQQQQQPQSSDQDDKNRIENYASDPTLNALNDLLSKNPNDETALYKRGVFFAGKGAYKLALADLDRAIALNPKDVQALNNRCFVKAIVGDLQSALESCNSALQLRPYFVDALDSRGLVYLKLDLNIEAINDFSAALKLNAKLASSLYGRGVARRRSGQAAAGDADVSAALQIDPDLANEFKAYGVR